MEGVRSVYTLSDEQQAAVDCDDAAIVVVASAGSGKTEVVARRVERLLTSSAGDSSRVLALSYTIKAADELRDRFRERLGDLHRRVDTDTVHGFAHSLLRQGGTRIGLPVEPEVLSRDADRVELLGRWLAAEGARVPDDLAAALGALDLSRARLQEAPLGVEWDAALRDAGAVDYPAMLERANELLGLASTRRQLSRLYSHVIVDEAQNLTPAQYALLTAVIGLPGDDQIPAMIVGDDKQSIVSFAGADPALIRQFAKDYRATRFELTKNFRSAAAIATVGQSVAKALGQRGEVEPADSFAAPGVVLTYEADDETDEAARVTAWIVDLLRDGLPKDVVAAGESTTVRPEDIAVLARSAAALRYTRAALEAAGIQAASASAPEDWLATTAADVIVELIALQSSADHKSTHWQLARLLDADEDDVRDPAALKQTLAGNADEGLRAIASLCDAEQPSDLVAALASIELSADTTSPLSVAWHSDCALIGESWLAFTAQASAAEWTWGNFGLYLSRIQRGTTGGSGVKLMTIHKAQGQEFPVVALIGLNDGQLPDFRANDEASQLAELRTFYVAVSRASRALLVTRPRFRDTRFGPRGSRESAYWEFLVAS